MAFIIKDRVKVNTTTTGTGDITLGSAVATFDTFESYMSNGDTTYYAIVTKVSNTDEWEVGIGTWNTGNTLTRTTVLAGSNGTSAVNFTAGDKDVFMTYPASKAVYTDASGNIDINGGTIDGATVGATSASTGKFTTLQTTSNADIGGYIDMEILSDHAAYQEGRVWYDSLHKTLNFYSDVNNVVHELGIEEHQRVYNNTGSTISKGAPLYFSGNYTAGTIDVPTVGLADATDVNAYNAQGLAAADIADGSYGYCIVAGQLTEVDTSSLTAGTNFFVGLTPGAVQNASPTYPNYPMCLGWVVNSDATDGVLLVNQQNHSVNSFRVRTDAHIGGDFQVDGDLTVLGTTTSVSTSDVTAGAPFYRANEGDAIGEAGTTFSGSGLDDAFFSGHFTGTTATTYYVKIDGTGTPDTFSVSTDNFATTISTGNAITGNPQLIHSADNIYVEFGATTGHTLNDVWTGTASPINVDTGFFSNRNTGTSGVGYTHVGFYFDVSEGKWVLLDEYDPTPSGSINLADASTSYGTLKVDSVEGNLTGNVTGNVSGNAGTASSLATSRNIGGVAFNGTADINLPGVNTTGNQDTSGNAATATALETARTIQLSGDVTGSASFDGSADVTVTAVVQDDSHAHVISNVDGLQTALDAKADDTTIITAGNGLTGGGSLAANRTLNVGAGSGITVSADAVAHAATSSQTSVNNSGRTYIQDITLDGFGHVTGLTSATETVTNTNQLTTFVVEDGDGTEVTISHGKEWKFVEGGAIDINWTDTSTGSDLDPYDLTISHADTSVQASVNNSNGTVIQDVTLDTYGHVTGLGSVDLDGRYVNVTGDTMSGQLVVDDGNANPLELKRSSQVGIEFNDTSVGSRYLGVNGGNLWFGSNLNHGINQRVFTDAYHPNADKWTTARTNTVTLTGDVTGTGSASVDGTGNWTVSITADWRGGTADTTVNMNDNSISNVNRLNFINHEGDDQTAVAGDVMFDENFYSDTEYGSASIWPGGDGGGLAVYNQDGWGRILTDRNMKWANGNFAGMTIGTSSVAPHNAGGLEIAGSIGEKIVLSGNADPYIRWQEGTTDRFYIQWTSANNAPLFRNQEASYLDFRGNNGVQIRLKDNAGTTRGSVHANTSNNVGFLDAGGSWAVRHINDSGTYFYTDGATEEFKVGRDIVSGEYGTVETRTTKNNYGGYSINGQWVFMSNGAGVSGIYNDTDNEWAALFRQNAEVELYYNGSLKMETINSGIDVTGEIHINDSSTKLLEGGSNSVRIQTDSGYVDIGPRNTSYCHFITDRSLYYFDRRIVLQSQTEIGWYQTSQTTGYTRFKDNDGEFAFVSDVTDGPIEIIFRAQDNDTYGRIFANHDNEIGFKSDSGALLYKINNSDVGHEWYVNGSLEMHLSTTLATNYLDIKGNDLVNAADVHIYGYIRHVGEENNDRFGFNDAHKWQVYLDSQTRLQFDTSATYDWTFTGDIYTNRDVVSNQSMYAGSFIASSDRNLKDNFEKVEGALDKVAQISGYTYNFKDAPDERKAGLIAQEVEEILPEAVSVTKEGTKSLDYNATIAVLVEAIKEQQAQIDELKEKLGA